MKLVVDIFSGKLQLVPRATGGGGGGGSTDQDTAEINATMDIPALSLITANGQVANSNNLAHYGKVIGIVMANVLSGFVATAIVEGEVTDPSWAWAGPNNILFLNGTTLSATPPSSGWSQLVGVTRNDQTVFIRLADPILL